ncbi:MULTISPECIES: hypothetical protein [unclassified Variovorax]|uniref:hypothetical protein n=1 Tax=unclassified Variovorax TaxID=663243 RepID=UPI003F47CC34
MENYSELFAPQLMKKTSKPGRPSSPLHVELRGLLARVWVACLIRATGAADLKELAQICNELLPDTYPKRVRDWERYARGEHAPSLERGGAPGIVRILGSHFPVTLRVAEHPIWNVLDPGMEIGTAVADRMLAKLHPVVTEPFVASRTEATIVRDWRYLDRPRRVFPQAHALVMDYIACYLILFRNTKENCPPTIWVSTLDNLAAAVSIAPRSLELECLGDALEKFIDRAFLSSDIGPRWQAPDWPFYRGLPMPAHMPKVRAARLSQGAEHVADAAGNLKPVTVSGIGRGLAALLDGYLTGPVNPANLVFC